MKKEGRVPPFCQIPVQKEDSTRQNDYSTIDTYLLLVNDRAVTLLYFFRIP